MLLVDGLGGLVFELHLGPHRCETLNGFDKQPIKKIIIDKLEKICYNIYVKKIRNIAEKSNGCSQGS